MGKGIWNTSVVSKPHRGTQQLIELNYLLSHWNLLCGGRVTCNADCCASTPLLEKGEVIGPFSNVLNRLWGKRFWSCYYSHTVKSWVFISKGGRNVFDLCVLGSIQSKSILSCVLRVSISPVNSYLMNLFILKTFLFYFSKLNKGCGFNFITF